MIGLLERTPDAFSPDQLNDALCSAAVLGAVGVVSKLLAVHADVNAPSKRNTTGWPPLFMAIESGSVEVVRLLLAHGADLNAQDRMGCTPLLLAIDYESDTATNNDEEPSAELSSVLIDAGADINLSNFEGLTPLGAAIRGTHTEAERRLRGMGAREGRRI